MTQVARAKVQIAASTGKTQARKVQAERSAAQVGPPAKQTAKVFMTGRSQAVRIPAEFRFKGKEVFIRRDERTGAIILEPRLSMDEIFAMMDAAGVPDDFLTSEDRNQGMPEVREWM